MWCPRKLVQNSGSLSMWSPLKLVQNSGPPITICLQFLGHQSIATCHGSAHVPGPPMTIYYLNLPDCHVDGGWHVDNHMGPNMNAHPSIIYRHLDGDSAPLRSLPSFHCDAITSKWPKERNYMVWMHLTPWAFKKHWLSKFYTMQVKLPSSI